MSEKTCSQQSHEPKNEIMPTRQRPRLHFMSHSGSASSLASEGIFGELARAAMAKTH